MNKNKVHPVLDDKEQKQHIYADLGHMYTQAERTNRKVIMSIRSKESFSTGAHPQAPVVLSDYTSFLNEQRYYLMQLGFRPNMSLLIIRPILDTVLFQDDSIKRATS